MVSRSFRDVSKRQAVFRDQPTESTRSRAANRLLKRKEVRGEVSSLLVSITNTKRRLCRFIIILFPLFLFYDYLLTLGKS